MGFTQSGIEGRGLGSALIPAPVLESCRAQSEGMWKDGKPGKWVYAIPIVLIWLVIIAWLIKAILF